MATLPLWQEEYWVLLMQLYMKKPVGVKALYSKPLIDLSLELHIEPAYLQHTAALEHLCRPPQPSQP